MMHGEPSTRGVVREWDAANGWGVADSPDTPGGCWIHFSVVETSGYRALVPGQAVTLEFESPGQDGFDFRATRVIPQP